MTSIILRTAVSVTAPLLVILSIFLLLRGHDEPGGGFIGGLVLAAGMVLHSIAFGVTASRRQLRVDPRTLIGVGVMLATTAGVAGLVAGYPFLKGLWGTSIPGVGKLSTILVFDLGVFLVVVGTTLLAFFSLEDEV